METFMSFLDFLQPGGLVLFFGSVTLGSVGLSVCLSVRLSLKWFDLVQVKTKMCKFRGRLCLVCLAMQIFLSLLS